MEGLTENRESRQVWMQGLVLLLSGIVGMITFILLGFVAIAILYGPDLLFNMDWAKPGPRANVGAIKIILTAQQLGLFLIPALVLSRWERTPISNYYGALKPRIKLLLITLIFMMVAMPFFSGLNIWNQEIQLPNFMQSLEKWMQQKEQEAMATTELILTMKTWGAFLGSLVVVGIIPAICEEFLFRGALQKIIGKILSNPHAQVWIAATIFSVIHFQFYGFFPRLFLGAVFGYLYQWSGNIWYAVFAHFINNAFAVCMSFYYQQQGKSFDQEMEMTQALIPALISLVLAIKLLQTFYQNRRQLSNPSKAI